MSLDDCSKVFLIRNSMEIWFINLRKSLETLIYLIFFLKNLQIVFFFKKVGYNLNITRQTACLVFNPIMVDSYTAIYSFTAVV